MHSLLDNASNQLSSWVRYPKEILEFQSTVYNCENRNTTPESVIIGPVSALMQICGSMSR